MSKDNRIKVLISNDHRIVREGLRMLFQNNPDIEVLNEEDEDKPILLLSKELEPDVMIIDFNSSEKVNIELAKNVLNDNPDIRIIAHPDRIHMHLICEAVKIGITGFVSKECCFEELLRAVKTVYKNETYICPKIREFISNGYLNQVRSELDEKEYEIIRFLSLGMTSKEIALQMDLSSKTVDAYRRQIMKKLKINSVAELTKYAIRIGITDI